jgi:PII-like signaling protein
VKLVKRYKDTNRIEKSVGKNGTKLPSTVEIVDIIQKQSKFVLEIMTLVLSANIMGTNKVFIVRGRSFM